MLDQDNKYLIHLSILVTCLLDRAWIEKSLVNYFWEWNGDAFFHGAAINILLISQLRVATFNGCTFDCGNQQQAQNCEVVGLQAWAPGLQCLLQCHGCLDTVDPRNKSKHWQTRISRQEMDGSSAQYHCKNGWPYTVVLTGNSIPVLPQVPQFLWQTAWQWQIGRVILGKFLLRGLVKVLQVGRYQ